ncbi:unnamed protein product [Schistosoma margrebowiei]|uniref:Uncharacterized protein n=1 Tax=Schistosoma margrebowiei TaxID=48269 RepID=A0A183M589_9TREM|nr:unnamed protein product [Schistosoma margrebowiei]
MVFGGSQQETLDSGFVLFGTRQQGVPVILRELVLPGGFDRYKRCNSLKVHGIFEQYGKPGGPIKRERPKNTLSGECKTDMEKMNSNWKQLERTA